MTALRSGDRGCLRALSNDLEPAALDLQPRLRPCCRPVSSTARWAPWCRDRVRRVRSWWRESAAVDLCVSLSAEGLCRAVRRATGPVPGARVI